MSCSELPLSPTSSLLFVETIWKGLRDCLAMVQVAFSETNAEFKHHIVQSVAGEGRFGKCPSWSQSPSAQAFLISD